MTKVLTLIMLLVSSFAHAIIIGEDARVFHKNSQNSKHVKLGSAVAALFYRTSPVRRLDVYLKMYVPEGKTLCRNLPDIEKNTIEAGSAFLIGPDLVLTAGHNMIHLYKNKKGFAYRKNYKFGEDERPQFYFSDGEDFTDLAHFDPSRLYEGTELIEGVFSHTDFALIKLNRSVTDRAPLTVSENVHSIGSEVMLLGHPLGLPLTHTLDGQLTDIHDYDLRSDISSMNGNSGGPLISLEDNSVIGILSRTRMETIPDDPFLYGPVIDRTPNGCLGLKQVSKDQGHVLSGFMPAHQVMGYKFDFEQQRKDSEYLK